MEIHFDTEFLHEEDQNWLLSLGMVKETGETYYAVNADMPWPRVKRHHWVGKNIWPLFPRTLSTTGFESLDLDHADVKSEQVIKQEVFQFITGSPNPSLWGWYPSHDYVLVARLLGLWPMTPLWFPQRPNDVAQEWERLGCPPMPEQPVGNHHSLEDAKFCLFRRIWLKEYERQRALDPGRVKG